MKRLAFHSDQIVPVSDIVDRKWIDLIGKSHPVIGYIPSRSDPGKIYLRARKAYYARFGIEIAVYFELDVAYHPEKLADLLACDAIHLTGGNTFYFLHWLRKRNLLNPLLKYVSRGGILVGVSAGAILMTSNIATSCLCGDSPLEEDRDWSGLDLVPFAFAPHFDQITGGVASLQRYADQHQIQVIGCHDGDGLIVEEGQITTLGNIIRVDPQAIPAN